MLQTSAPKVEPVQAPIEETVYENEFQSEEGLWVSEETYWDKYYDYPDVTYEWNDGYLEERGASYLGTGQIYGWLTLLMYRFLQNNNVAQMTGLGMGFNTNQPQSKKDEPKKHSIRRPDSALILHNNPVPIHGSDIFYDGVFDLCIEAISYDSQQAKERDTIVKKGEYAQTGVKEYYILDYLKHETAFYHLNQSGLYEEIKPIDGDIIQSEVLPGFQFRISDLYRMPPTYELVEDEAYQGYILLSYQKVKAERERAAKERQQLQRQRAEQERQRAEQERAEKERLLAKLRELGIALD